MGDFYIPKHFDNPIKIQKLLKTKAENFWVQKGEIRALNLFKAMSERVPAYKDFLKKHKLKPNKIKSINDFKNIPTVDKDNYLKKYPLEKLCWDGKLKSKSWDISTTSGSTGEPFYFPREDSQNWQYAILAELYLRDNFDIHKKSTLYINAFPMGAWIGGVFTYEAIKLVARRGKYPLSIINPGIFRSEVLKAVKKFGGSFDQIIIGSYGPFLKDTLDEGIEMGINWKKYNIKFVFSAEGFTEGFRDYVIKNAGLKNPYKDTLNHYGTVDLGTMSHETPLAILIRRLAIKKPRLYKNIFGETYKLPTLTQYLPELFYFESVNENILCSAYSGLPMVRYDLKDRGGVIGYVEMISILKENDIDINNIFTKAKIKNTIWQVPFVYVYERSDFSVSLYAFQIYAETIKRALLKSKVQKICTGKFTMMVDFDKKQNQRFIINVELKKNVAKQNNDKKAIQEVIVRQLLKENSEFRETYGKIPNRVNPNIILWSYNNKKYFSPGTKQKWVIK